MLLHLPYLPQFVAGPLAFLGRDNHGDIRNFADAGGIGWFAKYLGTGVPCTFMYIAAVVIIWRPPLLPSLCVL